MKLRQNNRRIHDTFSPSNLLLYPLPKFIAAKLLLSIVLQKTPVSRYMSTSPGTPLLQNNPHISHQPNTKLNLQCHHPHFHIIPFRHIRDRPILRKRFVIPSFLSQEHLSQFPRQLKASGKNSSNGYYFPTKIIIHHHSNTIGVRHCGNPSLPRKGTRTTLHVIVKCGVPGTCVHPKQFNRRLST